MVDHGHQVEARAANPVVERAAVEVETLPLEDRGLAAKRRVIAELRDDDLRDQPLSRQPARHDVLGACACTTACEQRRQAHLGRRVART